MDIVAAIPVVREATVAVFRYRMTRPQKEKKGKVRPAQFNIGWGSGFCVVRDRYIVTAFHVVGENLVRNPIDKFVVFAVPGNGDAAYHFPVVGLPLEQPDLDLAILEIGPSDPPGRHIPELPVSFDAHRDGSPVLTMGFPAPEVQGVNIDEHGVYRGGQFLLKSHANTGILAAQYTLGGRFDALEFNVAWHHGESGGPVVRLDDPIAAFTLMQQYRNVKSPHGILPGPRRGLALSMIRDELVRLGARPV